MSKTESGVQLLARLGCRPSLEDLEPSLFPEGPKPGEVLELFGPEGCGKTQLLLHFVCKCVLPPQWNSFDLGGLNAKVIFIDNDYKFSILRLAILLEKKITEVLDSNSKDISRPTTDEIEGFITKCLKNLILLRCCSSQQLLCTLHSLETNIGCDTNIACMMIDSISAFYWIDRYNHGDQTGHEKNVNKIVDILQTFSQKYRLVIFVTKAAIFKAKNRDHDKWEESSPFTDRNPRSDFQNVFEYLGRAWSKFGATQFLLKSERSGEVPVFTATQKTTNHSYKFLISEGGITFT